MTQYEVLGFYSLGRLFQQTDESVLDKVLLIVGHERGHKGNA